MSKSLRYLSVPATLSCLFALVGMAAAAVAEAPAARSAALEAVGDEAMAGRAEGAPEGRPGRAAPEPIGRAIAAYARAVEVDPSNLAARRKLLAALYFQGEHVAEGTEARRQTFDRGREAAEAALDRLAARVGGREAYERLTPAERAERLAEEPEAAGIHLWSAVHWGLWGDAFGRLAAARQGVAGKIRDYADTALALDPGYEAGGPHRVLGRLHALAPRIPFFTGWIDRDAAIRELERAVALGPEMALNRLFLAEALLEHRPSRRADALRHLRAILELPPDPLRAVELADAKRQARELLARMEAQ